MEIPDISFIIPAYNAAKFLPAVIDSIIAQQLYCRSEIILIDNGSTDQTIEIARKYNLKILVSAAATIAEVRNEGAAIASAEILCFVDSDVVLPNDFCKNALETLKDQNYAAFGFVSNLPSEESFVGNCIKLTNLSSKARIHANWLLRAITLRKKDFISLRGFDSRLITCEDVDFGYRLSKIGKLKCETSSAAKHLDDPKNLKEFFQKEYWRGQDTLVIFFKHFLRQNEFLYLSMQIWFWISALLIVIGTFSNTKYLFLYLPILFLPPLFLTYRQKSEEIKLLQYFYLFIYNLLYYTARSLVLPKGIVRLFCYFKQ